MPSDILWKKRSNARVSVRWADNSMHGVKQWKFHPFINLASCSLYDSIAGAWGRGKGYIRGRGEQMHSGTWPLPTVPNAQVREYIWQSAHPCLTNILCTDKYSSYCGGSAIHSQYTFLKTNFWAQVDFFRFHVAYNEACLINDNGMCLRSSCEENITHHFVL